MIAPAVAVHFMDCICELVCQLQPTTETGCENVHPNIGPRPRKIGKLRTNFISSLEIAEILAIIEVSKKKSSM